MAIRYDWIIAVAKSSEHGVKFIKTECSLDDIKQLLVDIAKKDAKNHMESFKCGTKDVNELSESRHPVFKDVVNLTAYNEFSTYHVDYTAQRDDCNKIVFYEHDDILDKF